jgi:L-fuconolactonase
VVGWVDLTADDVADQLAELQALPGGGLLRGIRHQVHDEPDVDWICRPDVQRGIAAVGAAGLAYELLIKPPHLPAALAAVRSLGEVTFVVDHAAKPPIASAEVEPWASGLRALAARPNTVCKLSGLLHEADWRRWIVDDLRPYAEVVIEAFGVERVMVGSDWPVSSLCASYQRALSVYDDALPGLDAGERDALRWRTASRVYSITTHRRGATPP